MAQTREATAREALITPLPDSPMPTLARWLDEAVRKRDQPNPTAMALATVNADGAPSVRQVLCKDLDAEQGWVVFYTNRDSAKGKHLARNPRCALCLYWDHQQRQACGAGVAALTSPEEDDAYFASRPLLSRLGAWASDQSQPLDSRDDLLDKFKQAAERFNVPPAAVEPDANEADYQDVAIPRPPHWGGVRVWLDSVELWAGMPGRLHDRALWTRELVVEGGKARAGAWRSTRLQP